MNADDLANALAREAARRGTTLASNALSLSPVVTADARVILASVYVEHRGFSDAPDVIADDGRMLVDVEPVDPFVPWESTRTLAPTEILCAACCGSRGHCSRCHGGGDVLCAQCFGGGSWDEGVNVHEYRRFGAQPIHTVAVHHLCHACHGAGRVGCPDCAGSGRALGTIASTEVCEVCGGTGRAVRARELCVRRWTITHRRALGVSDVPTAVVARMSIAHSDDDANLDFVESADGWIRRDAMHGAEIAKVVRELDGELSAERLDRRAMRVLHRALEFRHGVIVTAICTYRGGAYPIVLVDGAWLETPAWL